MWVVSFTPLPLYPATHWIGGWVGPRASLDAVGKEKNSSPVGFRTPLTQPYLPRLLKNSVEFTYIEKGNWEEKEKDAGLTVLDRLLHSSHSRALSHYCSTRGLLAAGFPPWPGSPLFIQPGRPGLPQGTHIDAELSADAQSTWVTEHQNSRPQIILSIWPPGSWITGARHDSQPRKDSVGEPLIVIKCTALTWITRTKCFYCYSIMYLRAIIRTQNSHPRSKEMRYGMFENTMRIKLITQNFLKFVTFCE